MKKHTKIVFTVSRIFKSCLLPEVFHGFSPLDNISSVFFRKGIPEMKCPTEVDAAISRPGVRVVRPPVCPFWGPEFESRCRQGAFIVGNVGIFGGFPNIIPPTFSTRLIPNFISFSVGFISQNTG